MSAYQASWSDIWRFAMREMRGGLAGFRVFIACLALGVAAIAAVGGVTQGILDQLNIKGQEILGGDVDIRLNQRTATDAEFDYLLQNSEQLTRVMRLRAMARAEESGGRTLVELKAVEDAYPLYGDLVLKTDDKKTGDTQSTVFEKRDGAWGAAIEETLLSRLKVDVGDTLAVGNTRYQIRAVIEKEPDKPNEGFQLGPTLMVPYASMEETGLIRLGSLIRHHYRLRLAPSVNIDTWLNDLNTALPEAGWRIRDRSNGAPGIRRFIDQMGMFLTLVGLTALTVGGVGVGNAVRGYLDTRTETIATFKVLGADGSTVFRIYLTQIALIAAMSIVLGLILGSLAPLFVSEALREVLPVAPAFTLYPVQLALAATYGALTTAIFALWPLARARDIPAARLFRQLVTPDARWPHRRFVFATVAAILGIVGLAVGMAENKTLAAGFVAAAIGAFILLRAAAVLIAWAAKRTPRLNNPLARIAIANLHRPGAATAAVVLSLGLGLTLFAALAAIEHNMSSEVRERIPNEAPAFFFVDIQPFELEEFKEKVLSVPGARDLQTVPSLRGPVLAVGGIPSEEIDADPEEAWVLRGDRGLTYSKALPEGNKLVKGDWWPEDYSGPPLISLEVEAARGIGAEIGDTITVGVLGNEITATIANLREVDWGTFGFNFVIVFAPGTLENAPHTHMATVKAQGPVEKAVFQAVTDSYPGVSVVRMKEVLSSVNDVLSQISSAVRVTAIVTIVAGVLVLAGAMAAGRRARVYDSVVLKVLGATRGNVLTAYMIEYALLGLITGLIALALGTVAAWFVITEVFEGDWVTPVGTMTLTISGAILVTVGFGLVLTWRILGVKAGRVLSTA
ncbi:MAG: FtsX-like permease family protein [Pseudomonadota bacterium]